jgi:dipeptidyl aminopeptidase/acylaminoacyl peptidase
MFRSLAAAALAVTLVAPALAQDVVVTRRGALTMENVPETPPDVRNRLIQYSNTRSASFLGFLPAGGALIATRFADTPQLHTVASPGADRRQITFFDDRITGAQVRPGKSGEILFTQDKGGDEYFQGFILDPKTGLSTAFTEAGTRNESMAFSRNGARIAWASVTRNSSNYTIQVADTGKPDSRAVVHTGAGHLAVEDWSPTGDRLLLSQYVSIAKSRLFVFTFGGGVIELTPELDVAYSGGEFTADGKAIITVTEENSEFGRLARIELSSGKRTFFATGVNWDVEAFDISPDGRTLAYSVNVDGASELKLFDLRTNKPLAAPKLPPGIVAFFGWDDRGERLGLTLVSGTSPADAYVYTLRTNKLVRWTQSETGGLDPSTFVEPKLVRFPTFDSASGGPKEISAWVFEPKSPGPHPAIIDIHGGPESQSRPSFSSTRQYWVNELGIAVVVPNVRGSTGYGKTFVSLDNGMKRLDSVKDIGAVLDWMQTQPARFDMTRVVAYGGSYGGYMVYAAMIMFPERFAAGIDIVGIGNLRTFLENTSEFRRDLRRAEYGDERDPAMRKWMDETSSLANASKIKRPMFIIHGDNDPRVPVSEAHAMVAEFRKQGLETWLMTANDEGHGFAKKANQEAQREAETLFLRKVLKLN